MAFTSLVAPSTTAVAASEGYAKHAVAQRAEGMGDGKLLADPVTPLCAVAPRTQNTLRSRAWELSGPRPHRPPTEHEPCLRCPHPTQTYP